VKPLLDIQRLTVRFDTPSGPLTAISEVSIRVHPGETVCLVGESGSGKTITSKSVMRLIEYENGAIASGEIDLDGQNLARLPERKLREIRGRKIAMVFQEPMVAFDPLYTIGHQIVETIAEHKMGNRDEARERALYLLRRVGIPEPETRMKQYPGELSGGMLQRAMIAMALSCGPELLIADEPTTALDMTIQAQILQLLQELKAEFNMAILLITHDLGIAAEMADRVVVMYAGKVVEQASVEHLFDQPHHPYTAGLLRSVTTLDSDRSAKLYSIEGTIPNLFQLPSGCRFHPRCEHATAKCAAEAPELTEINGREVACWHAEELVAAAFGTAGVSRSGQAQRIEVTESPSTEHAENTDIEHLFEIEHLRKHYPIRGGLFQRGRASVRAVDDVSFRIRRGETFGLVGESGSGKSTLGRVITQLERATAGRVTFGGKVLTELPEAQLRETRKEMQMIFQDPYGSMNPRWKVGDIIAEPLSIHTELSARERKERVAGLLERVGLNPAWQERYPHEFSGGQRQRIGIARAIALQPAFVLADEAVSALDVSVQAQIVNLMQEIQQSLGLTYLFIAHGLHVVRHISDRIGVMYLGKLVEVAESEELFLRPAHHYTKALIASIPWPDPGRRREGSALRGEIPSPVRPPSGCRFHTRCPAATALCRESEPELRGIGPGHLAACHYPAG